MTKIGQKIKEAIGAADNISKFKKFNKLKASYLLTFMRDISVITVYIG
jgi:hypothetical protein